MAIQAQSANSARRRRVVFSGIVLCAVLATAMFNYYTNPAPVEITALQGVQSAPSELASIALQKLEIKGRAPSNDYERSLFGSGWASVKGCDMRNRILARDLRNVVYRDDGCVVQSGDLSDPYTGKMIIFTRGKDTSDDVQIDHVVALSDAWQKGAANMDEQKKVEFANDPLNLLAVDGPTNIKKSNSDAASWLPPNKTYRCRYVARQIAVKAKYLLWVTQAEYDASMRILNTCEGQVLPIVTQKN